MRSHWMQVKVGSAFISCKLAQGDCGPGVSIVGEHGPWFRAFGMKPALPT